MEVIYKNKKPQLVTHFDKKHLNFILDDNNFNNNHLHISPIYHVHVFPHEDEAIDDDDDEEEEEEEDYFDD